MAILEHSLGPLYFATAPTNRPWIPVHLVEIIEMEEPWRRGRAVMLPFLPYRALTIGIWKKTVYEDVDDDFVDDRWFDPQWARHRPSDIRGWYAGPEESEDDIDQSNGLLGDLVVERKTND